MLDSVSGRLSARKKGAEMLTRRPSQSLLEPIIGHTLSCGLALALGLLSAGLLLAVAGGALARAPEPTSQKQSHVSGPQAIQAIANSNCSVATILVSTGRHYQAADA